MEKVEGDRETFWERLNLMVSSGPVGVVCDVC